VSGDGVEPSLDADGPWKDGLPRALAAAAARGRLAAGHPVVAAPLEALAESPDDEARARGWTADVSWTGGVPVLLTHPDDAWFEPGAAPTPAPLVLWFHGRTADKELDPGRYLRWKRLGIAACAVDLPGHGERRGPRELQEARSTLRVAERAAAEVDVVLQQLMHPVFNGAFDLSRVAIGGMSAGGMTTLVRLTRQGGANYACDAGPCHAFRAAILEAAAGDFSVMEGHDFFVPERAARLNPIDHLDHVEEVVPTLAVHSAKDAWVPVEGMTRFIDALRVRYQMLGGAERDARVHVWDQTGAPHEHLGFGKKSNDTKYLENEFLRERFGIASRD